ncbi:MAG: type II toxin-antitoxin system RelE/ParE family toxin [Candidatus Omnitrophica bacterium]|nr:type II toxin-antitoxin system RelE/ParE family toxin [Candidatus Omnitrophota bacterium]
MKNYTCIYYTNSSGKALVKELITSLDEDTQDAFFYKTGLLEEYGPRLRKPHTDNIGNSIFELRFVGKEGQIRVLFFFFDDQKIIFTNGFVKKTQKTPSSKIKLAEKRRKEYLQRRR